MYELFSKAGEIKRIIMGLDRKKKTPCGFCFVEYLTRAAAENSVRFISGSKLDERVIRVDYDTGYEPGREFGRGRSGGQVRDEHRTDYDPGRGGYGKNDGQSGMTGMQMWGAPEPPPLVDGPRDGWRGRGRERGRGRGRGRGRRGRGGYDGYGYGPPPPQYRPYDDGRGFRGRPPKRRRDEDGFEEWERGKVPRMGANGDGFRGDGFRDEGYRGGGNRGDRRGEYGRDDDSRGGPPSQRGGREGGSPRDGGEMRDDRAPTRNARFHREHAEDDD